MVRRLCEGSEQAGASIRSKAKVKWPDTTAIVVDGESRYHATVLRVCVHPRTMTKPASTLLWCGWREAGSRACPLERETAGTLAKTGGR